ncbi:MAG: hypothetical protein DRP64_20065 [Verrucomicrobia bacterium]|nr:MAG: hypothetical protein DRP64_20065 [Verrucomicrobiota bacterium]
MTTFKITVTKTREGNTGNIDYTKKKLKEFSSTLVFGEQRKSMGDIVTHYSYKEVSEYVVDESEKESKITKIKSMLSGHITFEIDVKETDDEAQTKRSQNTDVIIEAEEDLAMDSKYSNGYTEKSSINNDSIDVVFYETAAIAAKRMGLSSLKEASKITNESTQTLNNWFNNKRFVFDAVISKAAEQKNKKV